MSHFGVLVLGDNVEAQLAPFHEFECTGDDNEYVQEIDDTEAAKKQYAKDTTTVYLDTEGGYHRRFTPEGEWDRTYWFEPTPEERAKYDAKYGGSYSQGETIDGVEYYRTRWDGQNSETSLRVRHLPEGWKEGEVPTKDVMNFAEFIEDHYGRKAVPFGEEPSYGKTHKYGYTLLDAEGNVVKTVDRTNPNSKWDWYKIGGRWNGFFKLKKGSFGTLGEPGIQTLDPGYEPVEPGRADTCRKGDIDIEGMMDEAQVEAEKRYDLFLSVTDGLPMAVSWKVMQEKHQTEGVDCDGDPKVDWVAARDEYGVQPMVEALRKNRETCFFDIEDFDCTREAYIARHRRRAVVLFAVLKDGVWYERGSMGWWGCVSDEKDRDEWEREFYNLFDSLPDDMLVTIVDCHV
jgi:hypothetical protein